MILRKYGIELHSLEATELEQVRQWRNAPFVRERMFFQQEITKEKQEHWFAHLDHSSHYYLIHFEGSPIGIINVKNINWEQRTGEAGLFIGVEEYRNSYVPMLAILCMMDVYFDEFQFDNLTATIRADNAEARRFNLELGYTVVWEDQERVSLRITRSEYSTSMEERKPGLASLNKLPSDFVLNEEERHVFFRK